MVKYLKVGGHYTVSHLANRPGRCAYMQDLPGILVPTHAARRRTARCQRPRPLVSGYDAVCFEAHRHVIEDRAGKLTRWHRRGKPPSGAGPDGADPGRSLAVASHPIGAYRCSGRTDRSLTHGDEPLPDGVGCRRASGQGGLTPCRARWLQGTQRCLARVSGR